MKRFTDFEFSQEFQVLFKTLRFNKYQKALDKSIIIQGRLRDIKNARNH